MILFDFTPNGYPDCTVNAWIHQHDSLDENLRLMHPAVVVCPGGGYKAISSRESAPVAEPFFAAGYNVFILNYSVREQAKDFRPLCQLAATVAHIRANSKEFLTLPDKIAVMGFSAGGHLAASLGTLFNNVRFLDVFGRCGHIRPDALVLGYPVITADDVYSQVTSIENVSGAKKGLDKYRWFDLTNHVDEETPPTFLWHTAADELVPVENTLLFSLALSRFHVPYECHILPEGPHGMSVCTNEIRSYHPYNARWVDWSIRWLNQQFNNEY
jgi:acetyl esterase/lipase